VLLGHRFDKTTLRKNHLSFRRESLKKGVRAIISIDLSVILH
jgi:hypothetical protein